MTKTAVPFDRPFTSADVEAAGLRIATLRGWRERNDVVEITSGVFIARALATSDSWRIIYSSRAVASGRRPVTIAGAAMIHGLWTPPALPAVTHGSTRRHTIPDGVIERRGGLLVPSREWTAVQLARWQPLHAAVIPLDSALALGSARGNLHELAAHMTSWPGAAELVAAVAESDGRSESPLESWSRLLMVQLGLPRPQLQHDVRIRARRYRPDFLWPDHKVIGEADGMGKYSNNEAIDDEKRRQGHLQGAGYLVYRWGWAEVRPDPWRWGEGLRQLLA